MLRWALNQAQEHLHEYEECHLSCNFFVFCFVFFFFVLFFFVKSKLKTFLFQITIITNQSINQIPSCSIFNVEWWFEQFWRITLQINAQENKTANTNAQFFGVFALIQHLAKKNVICSHNTQCQLTSIKISPCFGAGWCQVRPRAIRVSRSESIATSKPWRQSTSLF